MNHVLGSVTPSPSSAPSPPPLRSLPDRLRRDLGELLHLVESMVVLEAGEISRKELDKAVRDTVGDGSGVQFRCMDRGMCCKRLTGCLVI